MFLYIAIFELVIFALFVLSKEIFFYGEERLIVVCYLFLFFLGFFSLSQAVVNDFNARANSIKEELDVYFYNIINTILNTEKFIKVAFNIFYSLLVLYKSLLNEFNFYFLHYSTNPSFKRFVINFKAQQLLSSASGFYWNVKQSLVKNHTTKFLYNEFVQDQYKVSYNVNKSNYLISLIDKELNSRLVNASKLSSDNYIFDLNSVKVDTAVNYFNK